MKVITLSPTADTESEVVLDEPTNNILMKVSHKQEQESLMNVIILR